MISDNHLRVFAFLFLYKVFGALGYIPFTCILIIFVIIRSVLMMALSRIAHA